MKNKVFLLFFFLLLSAVANCQGWQYYDSLRVVSTASKNYDSALVYAENALRMSSADPGENDTVYANMLYNYAIVNYYLKRFNETINYLKKEKEVRYRIQGGEHPDYALTLNNLAYFYQLTGQLIEAEPLFIQAHEIRRKVLGENNPAYSTSLSNLASLYYASGNYYRAEPYLVESVAKWKEQKGDMSPEYARALNNLAALYMAIGNYQEAENVLKESIKIKEKNFGSTHIEYAKAMNNMAQLYRESSNYMSDPSDKIKRMMMADSLYTICEKITKAELGEKSEEYALLMNNMGILNQELKRWDASEISYEKGKKTWAELMREKHPEYARCENNLGSLYFDMARASVHDSVFNENVYQSEKCFDKAAEIWKDVLGEIHPDYILSLHKRATLYALWQSRLPEGALRDEKNKLSEALFLECIEKINMSNLQNFAYLSEKEKEMYFTKRAKYFPSFYSFALTRQKENSGIAKVVFNNVILNKGLMLKSSTAMRIAIRESNDTNLIAQYQKWTDIKKDLSRLYATEISKRTKDISELEQQAEALEKEMVRTSVVFSDFRRMQELNWEKVHNQLKPGEAAIEFLHFPLNGDSVIYCALITTAESDSVKMVRICSESDLMRLFNNVRTFNLNFVSRIYGSRSKFNDALYKMIWSPLEPYLKDTRTIFYSPDGLLHKISLEAISIEKNVLLSERYELRRMTSTGNVAFFEDEHWAAYHTAALFGGIDYSYDSSWVNVWSYLPGTRTEIENIAALLRKNNVQTQYYSGRQATEDTLKQVASSSHILHLSTHGYFYPDPESRNESENESENEEQVEEGAVAFRSTTGFGNWMFMQNRNPLMRSGLALAGSNSVWSHRYAGQGEDGVLTAQEVAQLDLSETKLVVLSACETGLGDIRGSEGVYGLQRAFKMAGVKYIIMSLWQVPDKETAEFMELFYRFLLKEKTSTLQGLNVRTAFRKAQNTMRKKYDPYYWGAFVLIE